MNLTPLRCVGLGAVVVMSTALAQVSTSCISTKNQVVLRQRVAELEAAEGRLDTRILQAEVDALQRRGLIGDDEVAEFAAIIERADAPKGPVNTPEGAATAYQALDTKVAELQAEADAAIKEMVEELEMPVPGPNDVEYSTRQTLALAALASVMTQLSAATAPAEDDSIEAVQARAQAALAEKMAELDRQTPPVAATASPAPASRPAPSPTMRLRDSARTNRPPKFAVRAVDAASFATMVELIWKARVSCDQSCAAT